MEPLVTEPLVDRFLHRSRRLRDPLVLYSATATDVAFHATHYVNKYYSSEVVDTEFYQDRLAQCVLERYMQRFGS